MDPWGRLRLGMVGGIVSVALAFAAACGGSSVPDPSGSGPSPTTAESWFATYRDAQRQGVVNLPVKDARRLDMHVRAREYLAAWSSADGSAVRQLYATDATATDDLAAVQAMGAAQIGTLAEAGVAAGGLPGVTLDSLPDLGGPANFAAGRPTSGEAPPSLETQVLLVTVDDGSGCPAIWRSCSTSTPTGSSRPSAVTTAQTTWCGAPAACSHPGGGTR